MSFKIAILAALIGLGTLSACAQQEEVTYVVPTPGSAPAR